MENKPNYKTSEFWIALITNVIGMLVMTGVISTEESQKITSNLQPVIGGIISIASTLGYIFARVQIKGIRAQMVMCAHNVRYSTDAGAKATDASTAAQDMMAKAGV